MAGGLEVYSTFGVERSTFNITKFKSTNDIYNLSKIAADYRSIVTLATRIDFEIVHRIGYPSV